MERLQKHLRSNKIVSLFIGSGTTTLDLLSNHLYTITLQFKNRDLERHYYSFTNEEAVPYLALGIILAALLFLVYIPLDMSYNQFIPLLISRVATGCIMLISLAFILLNRTVRNNCVHLMTVLISLMIVSAMASLVLRNDIGFAPLFMILLFGNLQCAAFAWQRAISGFLLILAHALVWICYLNKEAPNFLRTQTLTYILFYISAILASYMRELAHRRVYFIIHAMLTTSGELKHYSVMLSSSADNLSKALRASKRLSIAPRIIASVSSGSVPSISSPPSLDTVSDPYSLASSSDDMVVTPPPISPLSSPTLTDISSTPPLLPTTPRPPASSVDYTNLQDSYLRFADRVIDIMSMCIPARGDAVMSEIGYHMTVYMYVRRLQHRMSQRFLDAAREKRFQVWHVKDTAATLRRFLVFAFTESESHILLIIRFAIIMPCIFTSLIVSILPLPRIRKWRGYIVATLEICCCAASLSMGLYAWYTLKPRMGSHAVMAYDLYFGYVVRFVVYSFCGMGLLWMQSTFTAVFVLVLMFVTTILLGVPLALSPLIIILIGFIISFYDEKTRRVEFFLLYYREEILAYIRAKEQHELPMAVHAFGDIPVAPQHVNNDEDDGV